MDRLPLEWNRVTPGQLNLVLMALVEFRSNVTYRAFKVIFRDSHTSISHLWSMFYSECKSDLILFYARLDGPNRIYLDVYLSNYIFDEGMELLNAS